MKLTYDAKLCDKVWRHNNDHFVIGNFLGKSNNFLGWNYFVSLPDLKTEILYSGSLDDIDYYDLKENIKATKKHRQASFFQDFFNSLKKESKNELKFYKEARVGLCSDDDGTYGLLFNDKILHCEDETAYFKINGNDKQFFITTKLDDALLAHRATKGTTYLIDESRVEESLSIFSIKKKQHNLFLLCTNPTLKDLKKIDPEDYKKAKINSVKKFLNVFCLFPPGKAGSKSPETFTDFFKKDPAECDKFFNKKRDKYPELQVLGKAGKSIYLFSRFTNRPFELKARDTQSELSLVAPLAYFKDKFGSTTAKKIIEVLFDQSRDKNYKSEKICPAGIYAENNNLIVNTGESIIGKVDFNLGNEYIKSGYFPTPKKVESNNKKFYFLYEKILKNLPTSDSEIDGLVIVAWSILAIFAKALPSRFTLCLIGDRGSGKNHTRDYLILQLQKRFMSIVKKYSPGDTWASFKDDLREGKAVCMFEEAEGRSYDEQILKNIRTSTYEAVELKQMSVSGGRLKTPVNFISLFLYNFKPSMNSLADISRSYIVNYSNLLLTSEKKKEQAIGFLQSDLPQLGEELFNMVYHKWADFLYYTDEAKKDPHLFGLLSDNHKISYFSQIYAFYKTTGVISKDLLDKLIVFLKKQDESDSIQEFNQSLLVSLSRIPFFDNEHFKKTTIGGLFQCMPYNIREWDYSKCEGALEIRRLKKWLEILAYNYNVKITKNKKTEVKIYLGFPKNNNYLIDSLIRFCGWNKDEARSYSQILHSAYQNQRQVRIGKRRVFSVLAPIDELMNEKRFKAWLDFDDKFGIESLYG